MKPIKLSVNERTVAVTSFPSKPLLDVLREDLGLMGSKECCGKGECGSCSVLLNGEVVCSCLLLVGQVEGEVITTIEGIGDSEHLDPVQEAFLECGATRGSYSFFIQPFPYPSRQPKDLDV